MSNDLVTILRELAKLPALLQEIYGDLAKPGVTQVGKALGTVLQTGNTLLLPVSLANERARLIVEKNLERYRQQLEDIPPDQISDVPPEIGVPIAEKLTYLSNDQLSELYINLLAKASTYATANVAHPSFVNVINNLSPDEALILKTMRGVDAIPFLEIKLTKKNANEFLVSAPLLTGIEDRVHLAFPANIVAYFSNLEGLGIVHIRRDVHIVRPGLYEKLNEIYKNMIEAIPCDKNIYDMSITNCKIDITSFGQLFIQACTTKLNET